jgi:hypothetical protein
MKNCRLDHLLLLLGGVRRSNSFLFANSCDLFCIMVMSSYEQAIDTINKHLSAPLISRLGSGRRACVVQIDLLFRISPCDDCLACIG